MGHHNSRHRPPYGGRDLPPSRRFRDDRGYDDRGYDDRAYDDGDDGDYGPYRTTRRRRIPVAVTLAALAVWTLVAVGAWLIVDPLLVWAGGMVAPALDVGAAVGGVVGMGKEVGAVIEASRAEGIAMWLLGVLGWLAKPAIVVGWALGVVAILIAPGLLRRARGAGLSRFLH